MSTTGEISGYTNGSVHPFIRRTHLLGVKKCS